MAPKGESRSAERVRRPFGNSASVRARQGEPLKRDTDFSVSLFLSFFGFNACSCVSSTAFGCYLLRSPCGCHRQAYLSSVKSAETDKDVGDVDGSSWWAFRPPLCVLLCFSARAWLAEMLPTLPSASLTLLVRFIRAHCLNSPRFLSFFPGPFGRGMDNFLGSMLFK